MIIVFAIFLTFAGLKQEVSSGHLENHTGERPHVSARIVLGADDDFRGSVLARLDLGREVMVRPATVTKVTDLELQVLT